MKENNQLNFAIGFILIILAAFSMIVLMPPLFSQGKTAATFQSSASIFYVGRAVFSVYGFSSLLIPLFFLASGIFMFLPFWSIARGIYLVTSFIPFYTFVLGEKIYRMIIRTGLPSMMWIKLITVFAVVGILCVIEYIVIGMLLDILNLNKKDNSENIADPSLLREIDLKIPQVKENYEENTITSAHPFIDKMLGIHTNAIKTKKTSEDFQQQKMDFDELTVKPPEKNNDITENFNESIPQVDDTVIIEMIDDAMGNEIEDELQKQAILENNQKVQQQETILPKTQAQDEIGGKEIILNNHIAEPDKIEQIETQTNDEVVFLNLKRESADNENFEVTPENETLDPNDDEKEFSHSNEDETIDDFKNEFENDISVGNESHIFEDDDFLEEIFTHDDLVSDEESKQLNTPFSNAEEIMDTNDEIDFSSINFAQGSNKEAQTLQNSLAETKTAEVEDEKKKLNEKIDPIIQHLQEKRTFANYYVPAEGLLNTYPDGEYWIIDSATQHAAIVLKETLSEFKIEAEVTGIRKGPVITMFEILPAPGVKLTRIVSLQDNIALRLAASSVRIVAPIPGKHAVGIEVPNKDRAIVSFRELIDTDAPAYKKMEIPVILGKDITGEAKMLDLAGTPHLLIAGSTGAGKSVCVNTMILSILYKRSPQEVKMILIDPKIVELKLYNDIPHLLTPVITEPKKAFQALQYCLCEMERRYSLLDRMGVRDIKSYNRRIIERNIASEKLPYIVIIIDEFADLMATTGKELESTVARLAAMSRAVGIHIVLATQRPSIDVITGLIKANIPTRIAFMVASKMDSRIIIDQVGAEKLLGKGDMLYASAVDPFPARIQGTFVSEDEVERVVEYVKSYGEPEYIDEEIFVDDEDDDMPPPLYNEGEDPLYDKALDIVVQAGKASASYIQRRLKIGYNRAARLVEEMEQRGIVGPANGSKPRDIIHVP